MRPFIYQNPVKVLFGEMMVEKLSHELKARCGNNGKILLLYGGGSIKDNGTYDRIVAEIEKSGVDFLEFGGISANPEYEHLMKAVQLVKDEQITFLLAVGGGSVIDGAKFISLASCYEEDNAWEIVSKNLPVTTRIPLGVVVTIPATGSEMNCISVISNKKEADKIGFYNPVMYPTFSILDPTLTISLDQHQIGNGIVDVFVHILEQYLTYKQDAILQDRYCLAVLKTLLEVGPVTYNNPKDLSSRATLMWCATNGLNGYLGVGVAQDWSTHRIGHELTVLLGIDHARSLAAILSSSLRTRIEEKKEKLVEMGRELWQLSGSDEEIARASINHIEAFFEQVGVLSKLEGENLPDDLIERTVSSLERKGFLPLGERNDVDANLIGSILSKAIGRES